MGAFDGRRCWVDRAARHPLEDESGLTQALLVELERALWKKGCRYATFLIDDADAVREFSEAGDYEREDLTTMVKSLQRD
ncbi:MAG TPA: hypothetical protein VIA06_12010 [Candidatus Dormibacteraeota bacterium]|nr:hypothetical protein [Candidatus Dormibacteraeota bacterium]